jgi:hypothetical protein
VIPIDVDENSVDEFLGIDPSSGEGGLYHYNPSTTDPPLQHWQPFEGNGTPLGLRQPLENITSCILRSASAGALNLDTYEDAVLFADNCNSATEHTAELIVLLSDGAGTFEAPFAVVVTTPAAVISTRLADLDGDQYDDIILAGEGFFLSLLNNGNGTFETASDLQGTPQAVSDNQFNRSPFTEETPVLPLNDGVFTSSPERAVVFPTAGGAAVTSWSSGIIAQLDIALPILDIGTADINGDQATDIAILHPQAVSLWVSNP